MSKKKASQKKSNSKSNNKSNVSTKHTDNNAPKEGKPAETIITKDIQVAESINFETKAAKSQDNKALNNKAKDNKALNNEVKDNQVPNNKALNNEAKDNQVPNNKALNNEIQDNEVHGEDNLEIRKMKFKDRIVAKRERLRKNMESMSKKEKAKYLVYYYKWHALAVIAIIFCAIYFPVTIYLNHRPVGISYAILNNSNIAKLDVFNDYMEFYGLGKDYQIIKNPYVELDLDTYEELHAANPESSNFTQFPMLCYTGYYDVIITNSAGMKYCSTTGIIQPLDGSLSSDMYELFNNNYSDLIVTSEDYADNLYDYGIDISGTEFAKKLNLSYNDVYLCFFGLCDQNKENANRLLNYVFDLKLEIK